MKPCPFCAESIQDDAQFCPLCGCSLVAPATTIASAAAMPPGQVRTSGKAIASLICGIFFFVLPSAIIAIVLGHLSYSEISHSLGRIRGKGMSIAGLILGYLGISFIPILIIAAIAIPNLLRSRMAANEASAVGSLRSYNYAMGVYAAQCPKIGFPQSLANLGLGGKGCDRAGLLDDSLGTNNPVKSGYSFHYTAGEPDNLGQVASFTLTAEPITQGTTGFRYFFTDQTGVIRWSKDGSADADSPPLQ